jgi:O-antigen/teichoic acid export membrane protein
MSISSIAVMLLYDIPKAKLFSMRLMNFNNNAIGKTVILLRKCFMMVILMLINPALMAIPRIFVERLHGSDKLGIYSAISSPTIVISTLASCVLLSILPKYAEYYFDGNKKSLIRIILYPVVVLLLFGVFCVIIAHLLGAWFLGLIYGEGILPYIPLLEQVVIVTVLSSVLMCYNSIFIASRRLIPLLLFSITGFLICLALSPLFVGRYDIYGAAEVLICSQLIQIVAMSFYIWRIVRKMEPALIQQKEVEKED